MTVNGHLSIQMSCFPPDVRKCEIWKILSQKSDEEHADPELVLHEANAVRQSGSKAQDQELQPDVTSLTNANTTTCMASTLASRGAGLQVVREVPPDVRGSSSEVGDQKPKLVGSPGPPLHGGEGPAAGQVSRPMHPRPHPEVGESTRKVQQVSGLRKEVEMERGKASLARPSGAKRALAAAFTVLVHSGVFSRPELHPGEVHGVDTTEGITVEHHEPSFIGAENALSSFITSSNGADHQEGLSKVQEGCSPHQEEHRARIGGGDVRGKLRVGSRQSVSWKKGNQAWLCGHLRSVAKAYEKENQAYESLATHADHVREG